MCEVSLNQKRVGAQEFDNSFRQNMVSMNRIKTFDLNPSIILLIVQYILF